MYWCWHCNCFSGQTTLSQLDQSSLLFFQRLCSLQQYQRVLGLLCWGWNQTYTSQHRSEQLLLDLCSIAVIVTSDPINRLKQMLRIKCKTLTINCILPEGFSLALKLLWILTICWRSSPFFDIVVPIDVAVITFKLPCIRITIKGTYRNCSTLTLCSAILVVLLSLSPSQSIVAVPFLFSTALYMLRRSNNNIITITWICAYGHHLMCRVLWYNNIIYVQLC